MNLWISGNSFFYVKIIEKYVWLQAPKKHCQKWPLYNELLSTQNVKVARDARNVKCDFSNTVLLSQIAVKKGKIFSRWLKITTESHFATRAHVMTLDSFSFDVRFSAHQEWKEERGDEYLGVWTELGLTLLDSLSKSPLLVFKITKKVSYFAWKLKLSKYNFWTKKRLLE